MVARYRRLCHQWSIGNWVWAGLDGEDIQSNWYFQFGLAVVALENFRSISSTQSKSAACLHTDAPNTHVYIENLHRGERDKRATTASAVSSPRHTASSSFITSATITQSLQISRDRLYSLDSLWARSHLVLRRTRLDSLSLPWTLHPFQNHSRLSRRLSLTLPSRS